jgi:hypothetical protein
LRPRNLADVTGVYVFIRLIMSFIRGYREVDDHH